MTLWNLNPTTVHKEPPNGSVDALHYTATVDFVLGMYFNLTSYLCLSPVTPRPSWCIVILCCDHRPLEICRFSLAMLLWK